MRYTNCYISLAASAHAALYSVLGLLAFVFVSVISALSLVYV